MRRRTEGPRPLTRNRPRWKLWADTKYHNHALNRWVSKNGWYVIEIVSRLGDRRFKLLPWRWVVERTFGWLGRCRIHSKDYEHLTDSSERIRISMIQLMLRRLTGRSTGIGFGTSDHGDGPQHRLLEQTLSKSF